MVVASPTFHLVFGFAVGYLCRFSDSPFHLYTVLMMNILKTLHRAAKTINKWVVVVSLLPAYIIICVYHLLMKPDKHRRWIVPSEHYDLEQTKHQW